MFNYFSKIEHLIFVGTMRVVLFMNVFDTNG